MLIQWKGCWCSRQRVKEKERGNSSGDGFRNEVEGRVSLSFATFSLEAGSSVRDWERVERREWEMRRKLGKRLGGKQRVIRSKFGPFYCLHVLFNSNHTSLSSLFTTLHIIHEWNNNNNNNCQHLFSMRGKFKEENSRELRDKWNRYISFSFRCVF